MTEEAEQPPQPQPSSLPPVEDKDDYARFWFYEIGLNVRPQPTKSRDRTKFATWEEWEDKPIPESLFELWIAQGRFRNSEGLCIIAGKVWRGEHKGEYCGALDCDNKIAIIELRRYFGDAALEELAQKLIIEHHDKETNDPDRLHFYFYSQRPLVTKTSDKNGPHAQDLEDSKKPAYEMKGNEPADGIMFVTNSLHKNEGECYRIVGTPEPITFTAEQADKFMKWLDETCRKYGLEYYKTDANGKRVTKGLTATQLFEEGSYTV